jgi:Zn-dependent protease
MLTKKEFAILAVSVLFLAFGASFLKGWVEFSLAILAMIVIIGANVSAKKITAYFYESELEIKFWEIQQYGIKPQQHFKKPFPLGLLLALLIPLFSFGKFIWFALLAFDIRARVYRAAKRHGLYSFSEMTEYHIAVIAATGMLANLILALIGYVLGFSEFARWNVYYMAFNMLPFSELDGNKILFGNFILWCFLAALTIVALGYALLLV